MEFFMSILIEEACKAVFKNVHDTLRKVEESQVENIRKAADAVTKALINGNFLITFGTGHATLIAVEAYFRAGTLIPTNTLVDSSVTPLSGIATSIERHVDYYSHILMDYHNVKKGDVIIIVSNSGINAAIVECAIEAKKRGLTVVALTSLTHSKAVESRHPSGKKLYEVADIVIDNCSVFGDCSLEVGKNIKTAPTSHMIGGTIIHAIISQVAQNLLKKGVIPPIMMSANIPGSDTHNRQYLEKYLYTDRYRPW